ncbi:protein phosphatase 2C domain-containing protein [Kocuria flava]|uniref:PP2C family protein-serine/threonine phosphatase n=1 Tax=Kocuria flava TaxID=446860 RepID=UPI001FF10AB9|nr:PP2C family serine/threonine-protein phosphatase [Kocuria flava]MCJ8505876.1 protein phosphatase 2C domain-containing protein [Kocuria flava]
MGIAFRYAARSDVGRVRSKNDDSAYAGRYLAVVADGMGGHVGGDVASASAVIDLTALDRPGHGGQGATVLADEIQNANQNLVRLVVADPRLGGMGTTVTALLADGDEIVLAHIGDSRAYRLSEDGFRQVTRDHTFVQRLIDEGRLRPEEAESHPHKNVLMRVLGDVDASPEIEVDVVRPRPGERWLLCSDGLNAVVRPETIEAVLRSTGDLNQIVDTLVELTLDRGAPDNVTVVVVQVFEPDEGDPAAPQAGEAHGAVPDPATARTSDELTARTAPVPVAPDGAPDGVRDPAAAESSAAALRRDLSARPHLLVGAAANATQTGRIPTVSDSVRERRATLVRTSSPDTLADPREVASALDRADAAVRSPRRRRSRRALTVLALATVGLLLVAGGWLAKSWISSQYYVGEDSGTVAIYNGVSQTLGPVALSELERSTDLRMEDLPAFAQARVRNAIPADSLEEAERIVGELRTSAREEAESPGPTPRPTGTVRRATASPGTSAPGAPTESPGGER